MNYEVELSKLFYPGESPYMAMYTAGLKGIPIEEVDNYLRLINVPIRMKDIEQWRNGYFKHQMRTTSCSLNPISDVHNIKLRSSIDETKFYNLPLYPDEWIGTEQRFFPCTNDNRPMVRWGWKPDFYPELYDKASAKALSPCGWIGQNMLYQKFIVIDIDGVGHGVIDERTIEFGNRFKNYTLTYEDPQKQGSFHLYFKTNRIIPVKHFPHAKIDLMGNAVNAAVYFKNKLPNGKDPELLTEDIWNELIAYQKERKTR